MKKALVIGFGASGQAAFELLKKQNYDVFIYDDKKPEHPSSLEKKDLDRHQFDLAILSPGINPNHEVCQKLINKQTLIRGEADYALDFLPHRKIAITGTNGKTTVTYLCEHILNQAGFKAYACGNVSKQRPLSSCVGVIEEDVILVCELSSFQIESLAHGHFDAGIILNITPDHLDRYPSMHEYARAKFGLSRVCQKLYIHKQVSLDYPDLMKNSFEVFQFKETIFTTNLDKFLDKINAFSAYLILKDFQISPHVFLDAVKSFQKPSHRLEKVREINGIEFFNDSKATNIDATIQALKSLEKPVWLLAGGVDKGHTYKAWLPFLKNVKEIICFGSAAQLIYQDLSEHISCTLKLTLAEAILYAYDQAKHGDIVLLSPGCASFDQFKDYQDRGNQFIQDVQNIK